MSFENILGLVAGIFTSSALLPQLVKIVKEHNADSTSIGMLLSLLTGLSLWIWYGILREDWPIILTNGFAVSINLTILCLKYYYKKGRG